MQRKINKRNWLVSLFSQRFCCGVDCVIVDIKDTEHYKPPNLKKNMPCSQLPFWLFIIWVKQINPNAVKNNLLLLRNIFICHLFLRIKNEIKIYLESKNVFNKKNETEITSCSFCSITLAFEAKMWGITKAMVVRGMAPFIESSDANIKDIYDFHISKSRFEKWEILHYWVPLLRERTISD